MLHVQIENCQSMSNCYETQLHFYITNHCIDVNICVPVYFVYEFNKIIYSDPFDTHWVAEYDLEYGMSNHNVYKCIQYYDCGGICPAGISPYLS